MDEFTGLVLFHCSGSVYSAAESLNQFCSWLTINESSIFQRNCQVFTEFASEQRPSQGALLPLALLLTWPSIGLVPARGHYLLPPGPCSDNNGLCALF